MRMLCLAQFFPPNGSEGSGKHADLVEELARRGHDVTVVCSSASYMTGQAFPAYSGRLFVREASPGGARVWRVGMPPGYNRKLVARALGFLWFMVVALLLGLLRRKAHIVFATSPPPTLGIAAALLAMTWNARFIYEVRDLWLEDAEKLGFSRIGALNRLARRCEAWIEERAHVLVAVTAGLKARMVARAVPSAKLHVIPNGVDTTMFSPTADGASVRRAYDIDGKFVVVCAGALGLNNDLPTIIDAAASVRDDGDIAFLIVGDGNARAAAEAQVAALGLSNVIFTGWVPKGEVPKMICAGDVALAIAVDNPINHAALANRALDAMACARPVLCLIDGLMRRVVEDGQAGWFVHPGRPSELGDAIRRMKALPAEARVAMGANGRACVEREFKREEMVRRIADTLERAAHGHPVTQPLHGSA